MSGAKIRIGRFDPWTRDRGSVMFFLTRPSEARIGAFLARQRQRDLARSSPVVATAPVGYVVDHNRIELGRGPATFERARTALRAWAMMRLGWFEVWPPGAPIAAGATVALLARRYGVWSLFACRIVRVIEPQPHGPVEECGFGYATLPGHPLEGQEQFLVVRDRRDDSVWYDLRAVSRPSSLPARLAYPIIRRAQRRFAADSLRAMARAVETGRSGELTR